MLITISGMNGFAQSGIYKVSSPDKLTVLELKIDGFGKLIYQMKFNGEEVIAWSELGLQTQTESGNISIEKKVLSSVNEKFSWPLGEDAIILNHYKEISLKCNAGSLPFSLIARVYNGSIAFRYQLSKLPEGINTIRKELTEFNFSGVYTLYQYNQESVFKPVTIDTFSRSCDLPGTLTNGKFYISIGEAGNRDYTKAELKRGKKSMGLTLAFARDSSVKINDFFVTPWRTVSVAKTAVGLHEFSQLYLKLNPPPVNGVPDWIKPGKLIRSELNTQGGIDCIDFAAKHNFQYIMFDAGWYGAEFRSSSDPTQVIPAIDMPKVIQYGKEKGIGIILYVNYVGLRAKLDTILPLYKKWGVKGLKFGFVDGLTQTGLSWLSTAIKKVNEYGFILDIHDNYKPTGLSRSFPALLTQEGIRGDENSPDAFHTTVLPFTRFLAGPADFTFCYPNSKNSFSKNLKVSKGHQLALTVVYFSPLQAIFWYGKPNDYTNEEEIEFFKHVPTVWDESHYLAGEIGKYISVARKKGKNWFIGNVAGPEDFESEISFDFLEKGIKYIATIYEDDGSGGIRKVKVHVQKGYKFHISLKANNGHSMIIEPEK